MYTTLALGRATMRVFKEVEQVLGVPLRVIGHTGQGGIHPTGDQYAWQEGQWPEFPDLTLGEAMATGVTLFSWDSPHPTTWGDVTFPTTGLVEGQATWNALGYPDGYQAYDVLQPQHGYIVTEPYELDDVMMGELGPRQYFQHYPWHQLFNIDYLNKETMFIEPLRRSMDEGLAARIAEARANIDLARFKRYLRAHGSDALDATFRAVEEAEQREADLVQKLAQVQHKLDADRATLRALREALERGDGPTPEAQWQKLKDHPRLVDVGWDDEKLLYLVTDPVHIKHPDDPEKTALLGEFRWTFNITTGVITCRNTTNARGGFDHPHVRNGNPCFGEMGNQIHRFILSGELEAAVEFVFFFLESCRINGDDWARRLAFWIEDDTAQDGTRTYEAAEQAA